MYGLSVPCLPEIYFTLETPSSEIAEEIVNIITQEQERAKLENPLM